MEKSAEAFRTISEVADELEVPKHVLRFWEGKFTQIKPMKRGGGRRYYRPEDVELLRGIRRLLHDEGYTIKGVQKVIRQSGVEFVKQFWREGTGPSGRSGGRIEAASALTAGRRGKPGALTGAKPRPGPTAATSSGRSLATTKVLLLQRVLRELEACRDALEAAD